jgi:hypothetical protein
MAREGATVNRGAVLGTIAGVAALVGLAASSSGDDDEEEGDVTVSGSTRKQRLWAQLRDIAELDETQRGFLMITAGGETGQSYSPDAHNDTPSEVAASALAAKNNLAIVTRAQACGVSRAKLETGSWGLFQRLAPYLAGDAFEIFGNTSEACAVVDPTRTSFYFQIASAIETARDLQGYGGFHAYPTVGNLRLGWYAPSRMGYIADNADRIARYRRQAAETGYPRSFVDARISRFPSNVADIYRRMVARGL